MANPPLPLDALTLLFEGVAHGGLENCAVYLPAGHNLREDGGFPRREHQRGRWFHVAHLRVHNDKGEVKVGEAAALCIASRQLSYLYAAQILRVAPASERPCECLSCCLAREIADLPKLLGEHPSNED